jgi:hypothetical protein
MTEEGRFFFGTPAPAARGTEVASLAVESRLKTDYRKTVPFRVLSIVSEAVLTPRGARAW